jgi:hypothetical protein
MFARNWSFIEELLPWYHRSLIYYRSEIGCLLFLSEKSNTAELIQLFSLSAQPDAGTLHTTFGMASDCYRFCSPDGRSNNPSACKRVSSSM